MNYKIIILLLIYCSACSPEQSDTATALAKKNTKPDLITHADTDTTLENNSLPTETIPFYPKTFSFVNRIDSLAIFNKVGLNKTCHLINTTTLETTVGVTTKHLPLFLEASGTDVILTEVDVATTSPPKYDLAYFGDQFQLEAVPTKPVRHQPLLDSLHQEIDLLQQFGAFFPTYGNTFSKKDSFLSPITNVIQFDYLGDTCFLATYYWDFSSEARSQGILILVTPSGIYLLAAPCSSPVSIFVLNERLYLKTNAHCCDCGITTDLLYEYDRIELITIIEDGRWST